MTTISVGLSATRRSLIRRKHVNNMRTYSRNLFVLNNSTSKFLLQSRNLRLSVCKLHIDNVYSKSNSPSLLLCTSNEGAAKDLSENMLIFEDFITEQEETALMNEIEPYMRRLRYEHDHWDDVSISQNLYDMENGIISVEKI